MTTFVSALVTDINKHRSLNKYLEYGSLLLSTPVHKVIFLDKSLEEYSKEFINEFNYFIYIDKQSLFYYKDKERCNHFIQKNDKDTLEYLITQLNKNQWICQAIDVNPHNSEQFIWIDFGIRHMCSNLSDFKFKEQIFRISKKKISKIYIATVKPFFNLYKYDTHSLLNSVIWFFAGSIFGGNPNYLLKFAKLTNDKINFILDNFHTLTWEINIWYYIYVDNPDLFHCYLCNHNTTILTNF